MFGLGPSSCILDTKKTLCFGNWVCFHPQVGGEEPTQLGPLERVNLNHWSKNPVILSEMSFFSGLLVIVITGYTYIRIVQMKPVQLTEFTSSTTFHSSSSHRFCQPIVLFFHILYMMTTVMMMMMMMMINLLLHLRTLHWVVSARGFRSISIAWGWSRWASTFSFS
jgi:hypothetical protein